MGLLPFGSRTRLHIPEYTSDPANPKKGDAWVLKTVSSGGTAGEPIGLLLALTQSGGGMTTYQFSYETVAGSIKRVTLA